MVQTTNNITERIRQVEETLTERNLSPEESKQLSTDLNLSLEEFCRFQELKSLGFVCGKLNMEEALTVYNLLGHSPDTFNTKTLAVKIVLTHLFEQLLTWQIKEVSHV